MRLEEAVGRTVADVMHRRFSVLPGDATVADVREWFDNSTSHRMALLADDARYVACLVPDDLDGADAAQRAAGFAREWPTVTPDQPAKRGEELGLSTDARRVPVVDHDGRLLGIVAITTDLQGFCGA